MTTTPAAGPGRAQPPGRWRLTGYAALHLAFVVPCLLLLVFSILGAVLVVVWIGLAVLMMTIPATRWVANRHRVLAARVLGTPVPADYRPAPGVAGPSGRRRPGPVAMMSTWASDPMTWRDAAWVFVAATVGFVLSLVTVLLLLIVVTIPVWWYGVGPIMRARSHLDRALLTRGRTERLEERVQVLTESRTETLDHSAAELRRIERDLHDGAQARLVALSMSLGMADDLISDDPEAARRLVAEARATTGAALGDLRNVVRGIHPPVLADRGLLGAVEALAVDMAVPVSVEGQLPARPPAPVESAVYFAVAECLANVGKHASADHAWVRLEYTDDVLCSVIGDDGRGGADVARGSGMAGVVRRLAAFDGTMKVSSPPGGPTIVTLEVPCELSSPKTTRSSGTA